MSNQVNKQLNDLVKRYHAAMHAMQSGVALMQEWRIDVDTTGFGVATIHDNSMHKDSEV